MTACLRYIGSECQYKTTDQKVNREYSGLLHTVSPTRFSRNDSSNISQVPCFQVLNHLSTHLETWRAACIVGAIYLHQIGHQIASLEKVVAEECQHHAVFSKPLALPLGELGADLVLGDFVCLRDAVAVLLWHRACVCQCVLSLTFSEASRRYSLHACARPASGVGVWSRDGLTANTTTAWPQSKHH